MANIFPLTQELSAEYKMSSPAGDYCYFNNPLASNYVGPVTNVTGLDGPEVVESAGMNVERDGGFSNNFFLGRRPFTLTGEIIPASVSDRATKLGNIKAASLALQEDGKLLWTPFQQGAAPVYLNFRLAQPLIISGAWVKQWFFTGIAADPRIYGNETYSKYLAVPSTTEDENYRFTYSTGTEKVVANIPISFEAGKPFAVEMWMRVNSTWSGGTAPKFEVTEAGGSFTVNAPMVLTEKGSWHLCKITVTPSATGTGNLQIQCGAIPTAGNTLDFTMPLIRAEEGYPTTLGTTKSLAVNAASGWTKSNITERASNYNVYHEGNYEAPVEVEIYGPITGFKLRNTRTGEPLVSLSGLSLVENERLKINLDTRSVETSGGEDKYGAVKFSETTWWGIKSVLAGQQEQFVKLTNVTGSGAATGAVVKYRNTWY